MAVDEPIRQSCRENKETPRWTQSAAERLEPAKVKVDPDLIGYSDQNSRQKCLKAPKRLKEATNDNHRLPKHATPEVNIGGSKQARFRDGMLEPGIKTHPDWWFKV